MEIMTSLSTSGCLQFLLTSFLLSFLFVKSSATCHFPEPTVMHKNDPPWYSHVMADGSRDIEYYIRRTVMEIHYPGSDRHRVRWSCVMMHKGRYYLVKRQDYHANSYYKCIRFHTRSKSILQLSWSHESKQFDLTLCADSFLQVDPWPMVRYESLENDYTPCPFSGGFNIKITDSEIGENGCNFMHRPMRMEAECVGGEGVVFDFITDTCLPDVSMFVHQKTTSVAGWKDEKNYYVILRKNEESDLWCLVMPNEEERKRSKRPAAYLYIDLTCMSSIEKKSRGYSIKKKQDLKYLKLDLEQRVFPTLCEDEYPECQSVRCNQYVKQECMRSCNACNETRDLSFCHFPRRFKGPWFLKESYDFRHITIDQSEFSIEGVGNFKCLNFPDSPPRKSKTYSTVSLYDNGCRPRYTCIKLHRLAPSVLQYSLSQSYAWPTIKNNFAKTMCDSERFDADPSPVDDLYRSHMGSGKPIVAQTSSPETTICNISSVYTLTATSPEGYVCSGSMYRHCEDPTKLRLDFTSCGGLITMLTDFQCLATFEGHYWEKIIFVQNLDNGVDVRCFVFSRFYPNEAYVMVGSQCDKKSFNFARSKIRKPLLSLKFRTEDKNCISVPPTLPPTESSVLRKTTMLAATDLSRNSVASSHVSLSHNNRTHADQGRHNRRIASSENRDESRFSTTGNSKHKVGYNGVENGDKSGRPGTSFGDNNGSTQSRIGLDRIACVILTLATFYLLLHS